MYEPGIRVAVVDASQKTFLGYGTYVGDEFNAEYAEMFARAAEQTAGESSPLSTHTDRQRRSSRAGTRRNWVLPQTGRA